MGTALSVQVKQVSGNVHGLNREVGGLRSEVAGLSNKVCYMDTDLGCLNGTSARSASHHSDHSN